MKTLQNLFLNQLADMYDAERRIATALPKMARLATDPGLKSALLAHLRETEGHTRKLDQVFRSAGAKARGRSCRATAVLFEEGAVLAAEFRRSPASDAALIAIAQKVEHYEIASYGSLQEWAGVLGNSEGAALLGEILAQERDSNRVLDELARAGINRGALGALRSNGVHLRPPTAGADATVAPAHVYGDRVIPRIPTGVGQKESAARTGRKDRSRSAS